MGVSPGEVRAGSAEIRLENGVVHERSVADHIGNRSQGMAGRKHHTALKVANPELVPGPEQMIPL